MSIADDNDYNYNHNKHNDGNNVNCYFVPKVYSRYNDREIYNQPSPQRRDLSPRPKKKQKKYHVCYASIFLLITKNF